jgi:2,3-bisphosphoglycerate-independent phosphoglycerate mutase
MNFANADMVGHTGMLRPAINAVEAVDRELGPVVETARENEYNVVITADHGNAEEMTGKHRTSHTLNKVPLIMIANKDYRLKRSMRSSIAQVTPTILRLMGLRHEKEHMSALIR